MQQRGEVPQSTKRIEVLSQHPNHHISLVAGQLMEEKPDRVSGREEDREAASILLTDKILQLKNIEIFDGLSIQELAAVASVAEETAFDEGEQVFREGERGDALYLVLDGDVAVIKACNTDKEIELDSIRAGEYFAEMALLVDERRSATIRVKKSARFLTLRKQALEEIVREYPQIALHACRVLSMRIRRLHAKISDQSC